MDKGLVARILIQLEPSLAQEFGLAIAKDEKKLKALEIIKIIYGFKIIKNRYGQYILKSKYDSIWEIIISKEEFDSIKEVL